MFEIGDNANGWFQAKEHAIIFIRFDDKSFAFASMGIDVHPVDNATENKRRVLL